MRNYISILILIASAAVYTGCNETTVSMDNSVDVRVDSAMKAYKAQLVDADYGWIADISFAIRTTASAAVRGTWA